MPPVAFGEAVLCGGETRGTGGRVALGSSPAEPLTSPALGANKVRGGREALSEGGVWLMEGAHFTILCGF